MKATTNTKRPKHINRIKNALATTQARKLPVKLEHILVPIDFSEPSLHALSVAEGLAKSAGGTITLLYVVEPMPTVAEWSPLILDTKEVVKGCQKKLESLPSKQNIDPQLIGRVIVKVGSPGMKSLIPLKS
jgi:nucleotide-binding universal stress UspA family protein